MENFQKVLDGISTESLRTLKEMGKAKTVTERKEQAEILKTLCASASELMQGTANIMAEMSMQEYDDFEY